MTVQRAQAVSLLGAGIGPLVRTGQYAAVEIGLGLALRSIRVARRVSGREMWVSSTSEGSEGSVYYNRCRIGEWLMEMDLADPVVGAQYVWVSWSGQIASGSEPGLVPYTDATVTVMLTDPSGRLTMTMSR